MTKELITQPISKNFQTALAKTQTAYLGMVEEACQPMNIQLSEYQKVCVRNAISKMVSLIDKDGLSLTQINQSNVTNVLQQVAMLQLNAASIPNECYVITRNVKVGNEWKKEFEFGVEGDGNDKLLRTYGVDIKKVYPIWVVRENDEFTYPSFKGIDIVPPTWGPKDYHGKITKVVYPIEYADGSIQYHIAEREGVVVNLQAHIANNLMKNKEMSDNDKDKLNKIASDLSLEEILNNQELLRVINPNWKSAGSREAMILRKLRNNVAKKIPKDFKDAFVTSVYEKTYEDYDQFTENKMVDKEKALEAEVVEQAQTEQASVIQIDQDVVSKSTIQHVNKEIAPF